MKLVSAELLFATPLLKFKVPDHENFNRELLSEILKLKKKSKGVKKSNQQGWHSDSTLLMEKAECFKLLGKYMVAATTEAAKRFSTGDAPKKNLDFGLVAWANVNPKGAYNAPHTHPDNQISGCYYVNQPQVSEDTNSGKIAFLDPRTSPHEMRILQSPMFAPNISVRPEAGDMLLFPSYVTHWVHPNEQDEERVSIAFNAKFRPAGANH